MQNVDTIHLRGVQFYRPDRLVLAFEKIGKMRRHSAMGTLWPAAPAPQVRRPRLKQTRGLGEKPNGPAPGGKGSRQTPGDTHEPDLRPRPKNCPIFPRVNFSKKRFSPMSTSPWATW
jgi:hypothetical protein